MCSPVLFPLHSSGMPHGESGPGAVQWGQWDPWTRGIQRNMERWEQENLMELKQFQGQGNTREAIPVPGDWECLDMG